MQSPNLLEVQSATFRYGSRVALDDVTFQVTEGERFGLLGPNGGGKTTLFRLLATLLPLQQGAIRVAGFDASTQPAEVRRCLGVTFQSPSLDGRLTVAENLRHQGHLYGLSGRALRERTSLVADWLSIGDRLSQIVDTLSGGLKRRVEVAKSLLHRPRLLILDEPSTGLDPAARRELLTTLDRVRQEEGVTLLITTHLMDEAAQCDRLAILDCGRLVACDTPLALQRELGGDSLRVSTPQPIVLAEQITRQFQVPVQQLADGLRIEHPDPLDLLRRLAVAFPDAITSLSLMKPTLEDVFLQRTGREFQSAEIPEPPPTRRR